MKLKWGKPSAPGALWRGGDLLACGWSCRRRELSLCVRVKYAEYRSCHIDLWFVPRVTEVDRVLVVRLLKSRPRWETEPRLSV